MQSDQPLSDSQKNFLELTDIPILTLITTSIQVGQQPDVAALSEVMAKDFTRKYLQGILQTVQVSLSNSESDKADLQTILDGIYQAQTFLAQTSHDAEDRLLLEQKLIQSSQEQQRGIEGNFSARLKANMNFGG